MSPLELRRKRRLGQPNTDVRARSAGANWVEPPQAAPQQPWAGGGVATGASLPDVLLAGSPTAQWDISKESERDTLIELRHCAKISNWHCDDSKRAGSWPIPLGGSRLGLCPKTRTATRCRAAVVLVRVCPADAYRPLPAMYLTRSTTRLL